MNKVDKIKLPPEYDRRRKISEEQKDEIKHKYSTGLYSLRQLGREYGVSHKSILLYVNPESKRKNDERLKEHWSEYKATTEKRKLIQREHRAYKKKLLNEGKIKENEI